MKTYDLIKKILTTMPETRNSDKLLLTEVLRCLDKVKEVVWFGEREAVLLDDLTSGGLPSYETVARTRRKLQERYPEELGATSSAVKARRRQKQESKGTFIYRETV